MESGSIQAILEENLHTAFSPSQLEIINESHLHAGHQPQFDGTSETHFRIRIVADAFSGMLRMHPGYSTFILSAKSYPGL